MTSTRYILTLYLWKEYKCQNYFIAMTILVESNSHCTIINLNTHVITLEISTTWTFSTFRI